MSTLSSGLATQVRRTRFNPIRALTPELLSSQLESFAAGYLRDFALTGQAIAKRDDVVCVALPKRIKAPARRGYTVELLNDLDPARKARAEEHQSALNYFWNNITVTDALEGDVYGSFKLLVRQMLGAVGLKYAVHEITWQPRFVAGRDQLTATFTHVPVQFFESTTGRLRFLKNYLGQTEGEAMQPDQWLVTVGEGILEPLSICYMFKQLSLKDWVSYNERFGTPGLLGKTNAQKDSEAWNVIAEALTAFSSDWSALVNEGSTIDLIEAKGAGQLPFPSLVERMDRAIATICRGADLSTLSAGGGSGQGASLQGDEASILEQDDAELVTETLQRIDKIVIRELFAEEPLAYVQIQIPKRKDSADIRANITLLRDSGVPVGAEFARDQLSIPAPGEGEPTLTAPAPAAAPGTLLPAVLSSTGTDAAAASGDVQGTALNGAQIASLSALTAQVAAGQLPLDAARGVAAAAFPLITPAALDLIFDPLRSFRAPLANASAEAKAALFKTAALRQLSAAQVTALRPLIERLVKIADLPDAEFEPALKAFREELPALAKSVLKDDAALTTAFQSILGTALVSGAAEASQKQSAK